MEHKRSFLPEKAFGIFNEAQDMYTKQGCFSDQMLEVLHSYFGETFFKATEIIERAEITKYSTEDCRRWVYEVSSSKEQYIVFEAVNFCQCDFFQCCVLNNGTDITCAHVLTANLAKVMGKFKLEKVSERVFAEYLNTKLLSAFSD